MLIIYIIFAVAILVTVISFGITVPASGRSIVMVIIGSIGLGAGLIIASIWHGSSSNVDTHLVWLMSYSMIVWATADLIIENERIVSVIRAIVCADIGAFVILALIFGLVIEVTYPMAWVVKAVLTVILGVYAKGRWKWIALFAPLLIWELMVMFSLVCFCIPDQWIYDAEMYVRVNEAFWGMWMSLGWVYDRWVSHGSH